VTIFSTKYHQKRGVFSPEAKSPTSSKPSDRWQCLCGHVWNTFDTAGRCPACSKQWKETCCLPPIAGGCGRWSPHLDWYRNLGSWLREEIERAIKEVEQPVM